MKQMKHYIVTETVQLSKEVIAYSKKKAIEYFSEQNANTRLISIKAVIKTKR